MTVPARFFCFSSPSMALTPVHEQRLWAQGYRRVAGLDEAGRGAWAGPVVAAAVVLPVNDLKSLGHLAGIRDSKQLSAAQREAWLEIIERDALAWSVGIVSAEEIDLLGIVAATRKAMALALNALSPSADYLLIDQLRLPEIQIPQYSLPKGDAQVLSIAAASIVAKVARDRIMIRLADQFPDYGFAQHKGYGTARHRLALQVLGPSAVHRLSFAPLRNHSASCGSR